MSAVYEEIYSLLVPLAGSRLIVPRAAIIEVMGYNPPKERPENAPEWVLGWIQWQGNRIPLVSFEGACGQPLPEYKNRTRIAVMQAIGGLLDPPAFAVATQGYPYLLRVNRGVLRPDDGEEALPDQLLARVRMANERPGIPDLEVIERMIGEALGIRPPEPVAEAIEVPADEPTSLGGGMGATNLGVQFDDDVELEAALQAVEEGADQVVVDDDGITLDDLDIEGFEVDEDGK